VKKGFVLSILGAALGATLAGAAHGQSNVTLFGIVDSGITYTNNQRGHSNWQATSGNEWGPRWGVLGAEDLGGGVKTIFRLENGYNVENGKLGQGGRLFGRQAWVGVDSADWGKVTLGRQYHAIQDTLSPLQVSNILVQYSTHPLDNDDLNNTFRINNSVKYVSPTVMGLQASLLYGFSNATGFSNDNAWSAGLTYANGPLKLAAAYLRVNKPASSAVGAVASDNYYDRTATVFGTPLSNSSRQQIWGAGGNYAIGNATLGLLYTGSEFAFPTGSAVHFHNYEGSFIYAFTPAFTFAVGEAYTHASQGGDTGHYLQTSAGVQYLLSKRTDVYLNGLYQKVSGSVGQAWIDGLDQPSSTSTQVAVVAGVRHRF
jgi:general bacterial porin, GBP family